MLILDTDIIIWLTRDNEVKVEAIKRAIGDQEVGVSTITVAEFYQNIFPSEMITFDNLLNNLTIIPISLTIAKLAGSYWQEYHKKLAKLSLDDCLVAATAKQENSNVLTFNTRHYPMPDIKTLNPLKN